MKRLLTTSLLLALCLYLEAQITVENTYVATLGDTVFLAEDTLHGSQLDLGDAAGDQLWDFSILEEHKPDGGIPQLPSTAPLYTNFPDADWVLNDIYEDSIHVFFKQTDEYLEVVGIVEYDSNGNPTLPPFQFRQRYMEFPSMYGDTFSNTHYAFTQTSFVGEDPDSLGPHPTIDSLRSKFYLESYSELDAWGDVILPVGTYPTIRQHTWSRVRIVSDWYGDSAWRPLSESFILGFIDSVQYDTTDDASYRWWSDNEHANFWIVEVQLDTNGVGRDSVSYTKVRPKWPTGIEGKANNSIKVFPNPASDELKVEGLYIDDRVRIYDIQARLLFEQRATAPSIHVGLGSFSTGSYLIHVSNPKEGIRKLQKVQVTR